MMEEDEASLEQTDKDQDDVQEPILVEDNDPCQGVSQKLPSRNFAAFGPNISEVFKRKIMVKCEQNYVV